MLTCLFQGSWNGIGRSNAHHIWGYPHHGTGSKDPQHRQTQGLHSGASPHEYCSCPVTHLTGIACRGRHRALSQAALQYVNTTTEKYVYTQTHLALYHILVNKS